MIKFAKTFTKKHTKIKLSSLSCYHKTNSFRRTKILWQTKINETNTIFKGEYKNLPQMGEERYGIKSKSLLQIFPSPIRDL